MSCTLKNSDCAYLNTDKCNFCRLETGYVIPPRIRDNLYAKYVPVCPAGYLDCICDPAYIKCFYPDWYKELHENMTPEEAAAKNCKPYIEKDDKGYIYCKYYDDEDK